MDRKRLFEAGFSVSGRRDCVRVFFRFPIAAAHWRKVARIERARAAVLPTQGGGYSAGTARRKWVRRYKSKSLHKSLWRLFAVRTGLEPATPCVTGMYSNQLNYRTSFWIAVAKIHTKIEHPNKFCHPENIFSVSVGEYLNLPCSENEVKNRQSANKQGFSRKVRPLPIPRPARPGGEEGR